MTRLNKTQYAKHRGISRQAVHKAIREGRLQVDADGLIPVDEVSTEVSTRDQVSATRGLTEARVVTETFRARRARVEYEDRISKLLDADEVADAMALCAAEISRTIDEVFEARTDDVITALETEGAAGCRRALAALVRETRTRLAERMGALEDRPDGDAPAKH